MVLRSSVSPSRTFPVGIRIVECCHVISSRFKIWIWKMRASLPEDAFNTFKYVLSVSESVLCWTVLGCRTGVAALGCSCTTGSFMALSVAPSGLLRVPQWP